MFLLALAGDLVVFVSVVVCPDKSVVFFFFFQAEVVIRVLVRSRGLGDVYKRQGVHGEMGAADMLRQRIEHELRWRAAVPEHGSTLTA